MSQAPEVSVVVGVRNGGTSLGPSLASVLAGSGIDLELVVVDDGSTDGTAALLAELAASDPRIRRFRQEPAGLTRALIRGCGESRGTFIARQDVGDRSFPGRLERQVQALRDSRDTVLVSCWARYVTEAGEPLFDSRPAAPLTRETFLGDPRKIEGPVHGTAVFSREAYEKAGGYRPEFYLAQDLDLWSRLVERGEHRIVPEVLYEASWSPGSLSARNARRQERLRSHVCELAARRNSGEDEAGVLDDVKELRADGGPPGRRERARTLYFLGSCLRASGNPAASRYLLGALREYPLDLRPFWRLVLPGR